MNAPLLFLKRGFIIPLNFRKYGYHDFLFSSRYLGYDAKKIIWIIVSFLIALFRAIDIWTSMNLWPSTLAATNTSCTTCSNKTIFQKWNCSWRSSTRFQINAYSIVHFWFSYFACRYLWWYIRNLVEKLIFQHSVTYSSKDGLNYLSYFQQKTFPSFQFLSCTTPWEILFHALHPFP